MAAQGPRNLDTSMSANGKLAEREWVTCSHGGVEEKWTFRVLQWNTLADALTPSGPDHNFLKSPPHCLQWAYRSPWLLEEMLRSEADVLCLEEVDHYHDFFLPQLTTHGYAGLWKAKEDSPCLHAQPSNGPDGCALFYRTSRFSLLESRQIQLRDSSGMDSHQVAILARLQPQSPGLPPICVAVTHLKAKAGFEEMRLSQGKHLQVEMEEFASAQPAIMCGDFNAPPTEPVYLQLSSEQSRLRMESAYCHGGREPVFTTWKYRPSKEAKHTIDYIWYTPGRLDLRQVWSIPSEDEIGETALPSSNYPSDHVSLCAEFDLHSAPASAAQEPQH